MLLQKNLLLPSSKICLLINHSSEKNEFLDHFLHLILFQYEPGNILNLFICLKKEVLSIMKMENLREGLVANVFFYPQSLLII